MTMPSEVFDELLAIAIFSILIQIAAPALLALKLRGSDVETKTKGAMFMCVTFNNALFLPIPLVLMFIGNQGIPFLIFFSITQMFIFATLGSAYGFIFSETEIHRKEIVKRAITFPPLIATVIAILLILTHISIPDYAIPILAANGTLITYAALFSVGLGVGTHISFSNIRSVISVVTIRQILIPLMFIPLVFILSLSKIVAQILVIESLMPPAIIAVAFSSSLELDTETAATIVTLGTIMILPVIPFIPFLISVFT